MYRYLPLLFLLGCIDRVEPQPLMDDARAEASVPVDAAIALDVTADAPLESSAPHCLGLGETCASTSECLCSLGSGCSWDNVACVHNRCLVGNPDAGPPSSPDPFWTCCSACEVTWQACDGGTCLSALQTCGALCARDTGYASACPTDCLAY